ncbi:hypothetical protein [Spirosoma validum]|uniref:Uncharacterized protein n=1 Tax=Spirosoma validum TaxID=2771355 RepID=A0A927B2Z3_9BACT|nr:hypothetical protein [Spirosoma validum]MBD2754322.1 hypothetical protein [Spirosoma validum]
MNTEREKSEQRTQLTYQQRIEWKEQLAFETVNRSALSTKHEQERTRLNQEEINFHQREALVRQHLDELKALKHQDRELRMDILKRHTSEHLALNQRLK